MRNLKYIYIHGREREKAINNMKQKRKTINDIILTLFVSGKILYNKITLITYIYIYNITRLQICHAQDYFYHVILLQQQ